MGIANLLKVENGENSIAKLTKMITWKELDSTRVVVDAMNIIYQSFLAYGDPESMSDKEGNITKHIQVMLQKILQFKKYKVDAVFIFDNIKQTELKADEVKK